VNVKHTVIYFTLLFILKLSPMYGNLFIIALSVIYEYAKMPKASREIY